MTQLATIEQTLQLALQHHQAGRIADAESLYRRVLAAQPNHPDALHLLGALWLDAGNANDAFDLISRAIAINPSAAIYHGNLGWPWRGSIEWTRRSRPIRKRWRWRMAIPPV